jgi:hypothetical protein
MNGDVSWKLSARNIRNVAGDHSAVSCAENKCCEQSSGNRGQTMAVQSSCHGQPEKSPKNEMTPTPLTLTVNREKWPKLK